MMDIFTNKFTSSRRQSDSNKLLILCCSERALSLVEVIWMKYRELIPNYTLDEIIAVYNKKYGGGQLASRLLFVVYVT